MEDENRQVIVYTPNRLMRRKVAGSPCVVCGNALHMREIAATRLEDSIYSDYMHPRCLKFIVEEPNPQEEREDDSSAETNESIPDGN